MAAYVVILIIVAHRFLRLDLLSDLFARMQLPVVLTALLMLAIGHGLLTGALRPRINLHLAIQWLLWGWTGISKIVADSARALPGYIMGNYAKDLVFSSLVALLCDSVHRLRTLFWLLVITITAIAGVAISQHGGLRRCYWIEVSNVVSYDLTPDGRLCASVYDCFDVPRDEEHLRDKGWACEKEGLFGLSTVSDRIRYLSNLADPNSFALALVMTLALSLGLLTWPILEDPDPGSGRRRRLRAAFLLTSVPVMLLAMIYAASRAGQAAMALVFLCFLYVRVGKLGVLIGTLAGAPLVLISQRNAAEAAYSTLSRIQTHLNGYQAYLENPLFGVGFENYTRISFINAHNSLLLTATETGAVGSALFILGIYAAFKFLIEVIRWERAALIVDPGDGEERQLGEVVEIGHVARMLLAMLLGVFFCVAFLSLSFDVMWLFPLGIVMAFYGVVRNSVPEFALTLNAGEIAIATLLGALVPSIMTALLA